MNTTDETARRVRQPLAARLLRAYLRTKLRGRTRLSLSAAKDFLESLPLARYHFLAAGEAGELSAFEALNPVHSNLLAVPRAKAAHVE